ncbi:phosphatase PAP2 family protein [Rhodoglobus sp. NPDC076762]
MNDSTSAAANSRRARLHERLFTEERVLAAQKKKQLFVVAALLIATGASALGFLWCAVLQPSVLEPMDVTVQAWLKSNQTEGLTVLMVIFTEVFGPIALPIIVLVVTLTWGIRAEHSWRPFVLAAGTLSGVIIVQIITRVVQRDRPPVDLMLYGPDTTFSFPSGHVLGVADFFLILTFLVFSRRRAPWVAALSYVIAVAFVVGTALSRLYLGYHWTSDVLASMALSLVVVGAVIAIDTHRTVRVPVGIEKETS